MEHLPGLGGSGSGRPFYFLLKGFSKMNDREYFLLEMIRNSKDPAQAMHEAVKLILLILEHPEALRESCLGRCQVQGETT